MLHKAYHFLMDLQPQFRPRSAMMKAMMISTKNDRASNAGNAASATVRPGRLDIMSWSISAMKFQAMGNMTRPTKNVTAAHTNLIRLL